MSLTLSLALRSIVINDNKIKVSVKRTRLAGTISWAIIVSAKAKRRATDAEPLTDLIWAWTVKLRHKASTQKRKATTPVVVSVFRNSLDELPKRTFHRSPVFRLIGFSAVN